MGKLLTAEDIICADDGTMGPGHSRLKRIAYRIRRRDTIAEDDLAFIAAAFDAIVDGADPKKALGIGGKRGQGRRAMTALEGDKRMRFAVEVEQHRRDGMSRNDAIQSVAAAHHLAFDTIEDHYKRDRQIVAFMLDAADRARKRLGVKK